jgi:AraC-like DNA-binding protein
MYFSNAMTTSQFFASITALQQKELIPHARFSALSTLPSLVRTPLPPLGIELPDMRINFCGLDYLVAHEASLPRAPKPIRFQQASYRLWYQLQGQGILQNATRRQFGTARPGLLGIMEPGERHSYLHQRGTLECFILDFQLAPSQSAKCYWNTEIEGKRILEQDERERFEQLVYEVLLQRSGGSDRTAGLQTISALAALIATLFEKKLLFFETEQFPRNKPKSLVELAKSYMNTHFAALHHQNQLEDACGVDINYLNILFKDETGQTLYKYLSSVRLEHAKHLLEESQTPVNDIAAAVGYPNSNSFSRAFRKLTGQTPSAYRSTNRNR